MSSAYLDYAATTPVDPRVADLVMSFMVNEFGNAGSRTHEYGAHAAKAVERAREQVAGGVDGIEPSGVIFTSGATEANNLALLGLREHGRTTGRRHIVTTAIEHKAVLEPLDALERQGFEVDRVLPGRDGAVDADAVLTRVRPDTLVVSVMAVNNETGVRQPLGPIAEGLGLADDGVYLHTDAAQGYGKPVDALDHPRIDMVSVSGHKIFGPKGVGALLLRRRNRKRPPLQALMYGGGQERGLRPGTVPVQLVVGLGLAAELAFKELPARTAANLEIRSALLAAVDAIGAHVNGNPELGTEHILNISIPSVDSEAAILALKGHLAVSNGSACTSSSYEPSHVLEAMGLDADTVRGAIRLSWSHLTDGSSLADLPQLVRYVL